MGVSRAGLGGIKGYRGKNSLTKMVFQEHQRKVSNMRRYTANEGPVRIKYKCLVPIYVFQDMKLRDLIISIAELQCSVSKYVGRPILGIYKSVRVA